MDFVPLLAAIALIWKMVDFAKYAMAKNISAVVTQATIWATGVLMAFLLAASDFGASIEIGALVLGDLNAASLILLGLSLGSGGSVAYDFKKAIDHTDSAATPMLVQPPPQGR